MTELSHEALKGYLKERGIDPAIAGRFCKEVTYGIRGKRYFAIGFMNRSGGYELRNPMFKGCISPKDISCVSLSGKKQDTCCVFLPRTFPVCPCPERNRIRAACLRDL